MLTTLFLGYTDAVVIPAGARNIRIGEVSGSPNFLALKSSKGEYFLNGNWYIQWGGQYDVAGANGWYSRRHNRETYKSKGPIKEDLHVVVSITSLVLISCHKHVRTSARFTLPHGPHFRYHFLFYHRYFGVMMLIFAQC